MPGTREKRRGGSRSLALALAAAAVAAVMWGALRTQPDGDRAPGSASLAPAASFVGTARCASCHAAEHEAWQGSHHDLAMQEARPDTVLGDFERARYAHGPVTTSFFRRGDRFFVNTDGPDGTLQDFEVAYTFGVDPLQQYLIELPGGRLQPLSIAWDARPAGEGGQRWFHLYPGEVIGHHDPLHWTGRQQNWNFMCADCHSTGVRKGYDAAADRFDTTWAELNVGCEACHGPGSRHAAWAETSSLSRALFWRDNGLPAPLTERKDVAWRIDHGVPRRSEPRAADVEITVCAQCHARRAQVADGYTAGAPFADFYVVDPIVQGLYHADGQQRDEVYVHGSFLQSRMYAAGVTCSDCHDPHSQRLRAPGNQLCAGCHAASRYDATSHTLHAAGSAGAQCVACHMPATTYMGVDPRRDHAFQVPRPDRSVAIGVPNACSGCHTDRTPEWAADALRARLGSDAAGSQSFAEAFAAAERGAPGSAGGLRTLVAPGQPAIIRASALARLRDEAAPAARDAARTGIEDPDPLVRWLALAVLQRLPPRESAPLAAPLLADASRSVRMQAARLLAPVAGLLASASPERDPTSGPSRRAGRDGFERASAEFVESQRYNADRAEHRLALGLHLAQLGRRADAEVEYRAAIEAWPAYPPAYVNLADLMRLDGREAGAQAVLRQGLTAAPDDPSLHHALALSLLRSGEAPRAIEPLARAAALGPDRPEFVYAYAVALHGAGRTREAIQTLERARDRHPEHPEILFALATFHRDAGDLTAAVQYAERLARTGDPRGPALLQSLR